jgi:hypothetical protein
MNRSRFYKRSKYINKFITIYKDRGFTFPLKKEKLISMINTWKYNSNKFKKYTIFENTTYDNNKYILRDYNYFLFYTKDKKYPIIGEYAIWMDDTAIAHMRESDQYHFDTTWYKPNGFSQILIGLFHDSISLEKIR